MPPGAARRIREYDRWEMVRNICHCEAAFAAVAISRYNPRKCCVVVKIVPGDCQEVNCPKGAREATLGCGPNGPRNDSQRG